MLTYFLFIIGFITLIKGADLLVDGSSSVARRLGVSSMVIGLTIVAFGTSVPELVVNILASMEGSNEIAIGNVLGSNIANILLILGISAIFCPLIVKKDTVWKEIPFALLAVFVLALMSNDAFFDGASSSNLTKIDGLVLISFFVVFLYYIFGLVKRDSQETLPDSVANDTEYSFTRSSAMIIFGIGGLVVGGKWIVDGAISFASGMGVSEALIGLTIVAIGTSLPELATSVVAARKKNVDIAVGNIVGSNIFNIFWILGLSSIIRPIPFPSNLTLDLFVVIAATLLLFITLFVGEKHTIARRDGIIFVLAYLTYIVYLIIRG